MSRFLPLLLCLPLVGCSLNAAYVKADRDTFDAFAPAHREYVEKDGSLDDDGKARRLRLLESWEERIKAAEDK